jgi:hypothetical protein
MAIRVIPGLIAAAILAGCASPQSRAPSEPAMRWSLNEVKGEGVKLTFGVPNTDDVPVMLTCQRGSNRVRLSVGGPDQVIGNPFIVIRSGPEASRIAATQVEDIDGGLGARFEAVTSARDPVLVNFGESGRFGIGALGASGSAPADDPGLVRHFLTLCRP